MLRFLSEGRTSRLKTSLTIWSLTAFALLLTSALHAEPSRPNIILIMADDMNYGCCGEEIARENHCFSPSSEMN